MFDTEVYLRRIGCSLPALPTTDTLRLLHRSHLLVIPYDNGKFPERRRAAAQPC